MWQVLEELIGLSVQELGKKKAEAKSNSEMKAALAKVSVCIISLLYTVFTVFRSNNGNVS